MLLFPVNKGDCVDVCWSINCWLKTLTLCLTGKECCVLTKEEATIVAPFPLLFSQSPHSLGSKDVLEEVYLSF